MDSLKTYRILFCGLLTMLLFLSACSWFSKNNYDIDLKDGILMNISFSPAELENGTTQKITFIKGTNITSLQNETLTRPLDIYYDSLPIDSTEVPMIFIYDLYLGWAIIKAENMEIHKSFSELPKEQALLTKFANMENPDVVFLGE